MKKRIFGVMALITAAVILLTGVITASVYYSFYTDQSKQELRTLTQVAETDFSGASDYASTFRKLSENVLYDLRASVVSEDGTVLFDTHADASGLGNHEDRPELQAAFRSGTGENTRYSDSIGRDMFYYAVKLEDGNVLRFARPLDSVFMVFSNVLLLLGCVAVAMILLALFVSSRLTNRLMKPINQAAEALNPLKPEQQLADEITYDELRPFVSRIHELSENMEQYISQLKQERDTIQLITQNMTEGLIILDKNEMILSINKSAKDMLGNSDFEESSYKNIMHLTRSKPLLEHITQSIEQGVHSVYEDCNEWGEYHRYFISPVVSEDQVLSGAIVIIVDNTAQKQAEFIRRDFAANVSHELKTPLTTIKGFAEMISEGLISSEEEIKKYNSLIHREASRLITLIEDIIRLSEIEENKLADFEPVPLDVTVHHVYEELENMAKEKRVTVRIDAEHVTVNANPTNMEELFFNLMENAIKYNREDGRLDVTVRRKLGNAEIVFADTGIGIPAEHHARIFERFYRVDKNRSKETGGTGLGLSIVKHIVQRHNGTLSLESEPGVGTTITVSLPIE